MDLHLAGQETDLEKDVSLDLQKEPTGYSFKIQKGNTNDNPRVWPYVMAYRKALEEMLPNGTIKKEKA